MIKRTVSIFTIFTFVIFTFSCYSTKVTTIETLAPGQLKGVRVKMVVKTSGEWVKFPKSGRIVIDPVKGNAIVGIGIDKTGKRERRYILLSDVKNLVIKRIDMLRTLILIAIPVGIAAVFIIGFSNLDIGEGVLSEF